MVRRPGSACHHVGDGVDDVHGGGEAAGVVVVAVVGVELELDLQVGLALDEHAVAAAPAATPGRRRPGGG